MSNEQVQLAEGFTSEGTFAYDNLYAGEFPRVELKVTIITGQNLVRGALLGKITTGGKYNLSLSAASDGSEVPAAILIDDTDATSADKEAMVFIAGQFNEDALTYGTGHTAASVKEALAAKSIYLEKTVPGGS